MSWTDERIDRLKAMWTNGSTASQIAEELGGVSRNAVIGKAHRLGLESRPSPVKAGEEKAKKAPAKAAPAPKVAKPAPAPAPKPTLAPSTPSTAPRMTAAENQRAASPSPHPSPPKQPEPGTIQYRSVGPGGPAQRADAQGT